MNSLRSVHQRLVMLLKTASLEEVRQFVEEHIELLGEHPPRIVENRICTETATARLAVALRERLLMLIVQSSEARRERAERSVLAVSVEVASSARWDNETVHLPASAVLSSALRSNRAHRYVVFDADGFQPVAISITTLRKAERGLPFDDLVCFLDERGLNFRWRGGKGGLTLNDRTVTVEQLTTGIRVVIPIASNEQARGVRAA